jgi:hypothetical protein
MKLPNNWQEYQELIEQLEAEGLDTSDAQGVVDAFLIDHGYNPITLQPLK